MTHEIVTAYATPRLNNLKAEFFPQSDPDASPIILHRSDFLAGKGRFLSLQDPFEMAIFVDRLYEYLNDLDHIVITVVMDKYAMLKMGHWAVKDPYHYCAEVMAEKFVQFLERSNGRGDVYAESRKDKKNKALSRHFRAACEQGTKFVPNPTRFQERLTTFDIEFREKKHNNTGLQLADVYAKPSFDEVMAIRAQDWPRGAFSTRFGKLLTDSKYDRRFDGRLNGYGMKFLP